MTNWEAVIADLEATRDVVDKAIVSLRYLHGIGILGGGREVQTQQQSSEHSVPMTTILGLTGKSIREACIEIAKHNDGRIVVRHAISWLLDAGVVNTTNRNFARTSISAALRTAVEFEKSGPGQFRLKDGYQ